jgi:hypothetical protein
VVSSITVLAKSLAEQRNEKLVKELTQIARKTKNSVFAC